MNNQLKKTITNQFQSLENHLDNIRNWQIEADEDLWDCDHYSNLLEKLKETVHLLEKEEGLLENLETWQYNKENDEEE